MNAVDTSSVAAKFPVLQTLQRQRTAEAAPPVDAALVQLCLRLRTAQQVTSRCGTIRPQDWESFNRDSALVQDMVHRIANTPATSRIGLRAKALALHALIDEGDGELYEDASAPDLLAWSLVQDILTD